MEDIERFSLIRQGQVKDIEIFCDLLEILNRREVGRQEELGNGSFCVKLQQTIPTESILCQCHRWIRENYETESVESLHKRIIQESEFQTIATETTFELCCSNNEKETDTHQRDSRTLFVNLKGKSPSASHKNGRIEAEKNIHAKFVMMVMVFGDVKNSDNGKQKKDEKKQKF